MSEQQSVRGTHDLFPETLRQYQYISNISQRIANLAGFEEIATPILEFKDLFHRSLGDNSDIITKEMYEIKDRGGEAIVLRPEGTAGIARAVLSHGMTQSIPLKYFYQGPMFRYERPQKGRLRQFHQIGVELLGVGEPVGDIEIILLGVNILKALNCLDKVTLEVNTLGDEESRKAYRHSLIQFLSARRSRLSEESQARLEKNPLRILDSKDEKDKEILKGAPLLENFLTPASEVIFKEICQGLDALGITFKVNPFLVRGLDYYCHLAFEFTTTELGAQSAVIAGGRYDNLFPMLGGPPLSGVGWAAGIERLAMLCKPILRAPRPIIMIPLDKETTWVSFKIAEDLRNAGFMTEMTYSGNLGKRLKKADKLNAQYAILLGSDEINSETATLKDLDSGQQHKVPMKQLIQFLKEKVHLEI